MRKLLLVGENPFGFTGNSLMMSSILDQIDSTKNQITCFVAGSDTAKTPDLSIKDMPFRLIQSEDYQNHDMWGNQKLIRLIQENEIDFLIMIGIDIWRYSRIMNALAQLRDQKKFTWIWLFPYDLIYERKDWINFIKMVDKPLVYSEYGKNMVLEHAEYFRPPLFMKEIFKPASEQERIEFRRKIFPTVSDDTFIFGFIGVNQIRKDPQRLIKAFSDLKTHTPNSVLYLHTELTNGVFNLKQYAIDCGLKTGDVLSRSDQFPYSELPKLYNAIDCLVNCSMQEGLSWTVIQALACGTPVVLSETTAHLDYTGFKGCYFVKTTDLSYIPLQSEMGTTWIESNACNTCNLKIKMEIASQYKDYDDRNLISKEFTEKFLNKSSNINDFLMEEVICVRKPSKRKDILFAQHSSAGDVLMTTRCFKGIKEKNKGKKLVYMTSPIFKDIVKHNPYVDEIIDWDESQFNKFDVVYNPHGEHILPGGFNSLDVKLSDMYPYFCQVKPDDFFIWCDPIEIPKGGYIVVHTTGGDPVYRTYDKMNLVIQGLKLPVVQIGAKTDLYCDGALDYRGLSFNVAAYIMKQAKAAVVIDSFPSHLAGALGTPVVVLYGPAPARVVGPIGNSKKIINIEPDKLKVCKSLTNCWGRDRSCQTPCINTLNPFTIRKALISFLGEE